MLNVLFKVISADQDTALPGFKVSKLTHKRTQDLYYLVDLTPSEGVRSLVLSSGTLIMEVQKQHLSIFETHADGSASDEGMNSAYHFTMYLRNPAGITYKAHIYFNRLDQFSVMSQLLHRDSAIRDRSPIGLSQLDQQAIFNYSLSFVHSVMKPLRLAQKTIVATLQGTYQDYLSEINTLMLELPDNKRATLKMLNKAWKNLEELCEYDSRKAPYFDQKSSLKEIRSLLTHEEPLAIAKKKPSPSQPVAPASFDRKSKSDSPIPSDTSQSELSLAVKETAIPTPVKSRGAKIPSPTPAIVDPVLENTATAGLIEEYNFFYHRAQRTAASYPKNNTIIINALEGLLKIESKVLAQSALITNKSLIARAMTCRLRTHLLFSRWSTDPQFLASALDFAAKHELLELVPFPSDLVEQAFNTDDLPLFTKLLHHFSPRATDRFTFSQKPDAVTGYTLLEWCCVLNKPKFMGPLLQEKHPIALFIVEGSPVLDMMYDLSTYPRFLPEIANHLETSQLFAIMRSQHQLLSEKLAKLPEQDINYQNLKLALRFSESQQQFYRRLREIDPLLLNLILKRKELNDVLDLIGDHAKALYTLRASKEYTVVSILAMEAKIALLNAVARSHRDDLRLLFAKPVHDKAMLATANKILAFSSSEDLCAFIIASTKREQKIVELFSFWYENEAISTYSKTHGPLFKKDDQLKEHTQKIAEIQHKFQETITPIMERVDKASRKKIDDSLASFTGTFLPSLNRMLESLKRQMENDGPQMGDFTRQADDVTPDLPKM